MKLNWQNISDELHRLTVADLKKFGAKYPGEPFYSFAFDCSTAEGDVLLSLNTASGLKERAEEHRRV